jgi:hypothetical protein
MTKPVIFCQAPTLRPLNAVYAAAALTFGEALAAFVVYDKRLLKAARELGLPAVRPAKEDCTAEGGEGEGPRS